MPRFFIAPEQITEQTAIITGEDAKHIHTVLRGKIGDAVTVCDGQGMDYECRIEAVTNDVVLRIISQNITEREPLHKLTLFQGIPKGDKMEWIIQKCVELGVTKIVPVMTERVIVKLEKKEDKKLARWQKIAEAAAKQSERGRIPEISPVLSFQEAVLQAALFDGAVIPYEKEKEKSLKSFARNFHGQELGILIGPEGGFTEEEIKYAEKNGIVSVSLGKRILRTETAGMAAIANLLYEFEA